MPDIRISDLEKHIKADRPSRVYLIYGNEAYLKRTAVDKLLGFCVPEEMTDFNYQRFDGDAYVMRDVQEAILQYPMMSDRRCVLIEDMDINKCSPEDYDILSGCIADTPDWCTVIFWLNNTEFAEKSARGGKFAGICRKAGSVLRLDTPTDSEIARALCDRAGDIGCKLGMSEARYMVTRCGSDMTNLYSELDKLSVYAGRQSITRDMINDLCAASLDARVYDISRFILRGNSDGAFRIVENLIAQKTEPIEIFSKLSGNFIDLYRAKAASRAGTDEHPICDAFAAEYKGREFRMRNAMNDQGGYSPVLLRRYIDLLFDTELRLKSGRIDRKTCLEQLISRLCMARREG